MRNPYTTRLDEPPTDRRPACPVCTTTLRRNLDTGEWRCDLHGEQTPVWVVREVDPDEEEWT